MSLHTIGAMEAAKKITAEKKKAKTTKTAKKTTTAKTVKKSTNTTKKTKKSMSSGVSVSVEKGSKLHCIL